MASKREIYRSKKYKDAQRGNPIAHRHLRDQNPNSSYTVLAGPHQARENLQRPIYGIAAPRAPLMIDGRSLTYPTRPSSVMAAALFSFGNYAPKFESNNNAQTNDVITPHQQAL